MRQQILAFLFLLCAVSANSQSTNRLRWTVTVTNAAITGYSNVINGAVRIFTNAHSSSTILTNLVSPQGTATNLWDNYTRSTVGSGVTHRMTATNVVEFTAPIGALLSGSVIGPWGYGVLSTQSGPATFTALWPLENMVGETNRTNQGSSLIYGLGRYSTNAFPTNATANSNFITKGATVGPQHIISELRISGNINNGTGSLSTSNLVNSGNAIRSEGSGGNSLQVGSNAVASGALSMAIGNGALASSNSAIAVGISAIATNLQAVALGVSARTSGDQATALGASAIAGTNSLAAGNGSTATAGSVAAGQDASATGLLSFAGGNNAGVSADYGVALGPMAQAIHNRGVAIGADSLTTATNQIRLGTATETVSVPGMLESGTITNATLRGTNIINGQVVYTPTANTSLANGYNSAVAVAASYVKFSGPSAAYTNVGFSAANIMNGRRHLCQFDNPGLSFTILPDSGLDAGDTNRILTGTGPLNSTNNPAFADIIYDADVSRWRVISFR